MESLARRGLGVVAVARREEPLTVLARRIEAAYGVQVQPLVADLADPGFPDVLAAATADIEVGTGVYNAAFSFLGPLLEHPPEEAMRVVDVNVRGPLRFVRQLAPAMTQRGRGTLVLMSSLAGNQALPGSPPTPRARRSRRRWPRACGRSCAHTVSMCSAASPARSARRATRAHWPATRPARSNPARSPRRALRAVGGGPVLVPGATNRLAAFAMRRVLPRRTAIAIMGRSLRGLEPGG